MADLTRLLDQAGVDFDVLEHPHTERAADEAAALGIAADQVAKTLVLVAPAGNVRAVPRGCFSELVGQSAQLVSGHRVELARRTGYEPRLSVGDDTAKLVLGGANHAEHEIAVE